MLELFKRLYWDLYTRTGRKQYVEHFLRDLPSGFGVYLRERWYIKRFKKAGNNTHILTGTHFIHPDKVECGDNVFFGINNYIQAAGGLMLGSNVMLGPYVKIWTQNHIYNDPNTPVWQQGYEYKEVIIGDDVWIGANTFIMPGAKIGDKCVISANSVLGGKQYPAGLILAGYPARKIGERKS